MERPFFFLFFQVARIIQESRPAELCLYSLYYFGETVTLPGPGPLVDEPVRGPSPGVKHRGRCTLLQAQCRVTRIAAGVRGLVARRSRASVARTSIYIPSSKTIQSTPALHNWQRKIRRPCGPSRAQVGAASPGYRGHIPSPVKGFWTWSWSWSCS